MGICSTESRFTGVVQRVVARRRRASVVAVVKAAYRLDLDERSWLDSVADAALPVFGAGASGVQAYVFYVNADGRIAIGSSGGAGSLPRGVHVALRESHALSPNAHLLYGARPCATLSQYLGDAIETDPAVQAIIGPLGVRDLRGIVGIDPTRHGVALAVPLSRRERMPRSVAALGARVAAHLAAAHRLRRWLATAEPEARSLDAAPAVFDERERAHHVAPEARSSLPALREAVRRRIALERVAAREPEAAVASWSVLVDGQWSLIDQFEADGRRYLVARRNDAAIDAGSAASERERQILGFAALGKPIKLMAYELGLSSSTVSHHLSRAMRRLGARHRGELAARLTATQVVSLHGHEFLLAATAGPDAVPWPAELTAAEREIARHLARGESAAAISRARGASVRTVNNQIAALFRKVGVASRAELQAWAARATHRE